MDAPAVPTARDQFRELVAQVAARAKEKLPQAVNGRIESAARLVVNGDVEVLADGTIKVGGADPTRWYHLVGATCTCTDFTQGKAPEGWCKHRISAGIHKRVQELLPLDGAPGQAPAAESGPDVHPGSTPLPEAAASANVRVSIDGHEVQWTLRGTSEAQVFDRLHALLQRADVRPLPKPAARTGGWQKRR